MGRDPAKLDAELVALVRERSRPAADAEIRAALAPLTTAEERRLRAALQAPPEGSLGPFAWADIARGADPQVAVSREFSGYYTLKAERDALAAMLKTPSPDPAPEPDPRPARTPAPAPGPHPSPRRAK